MTIPHARESFEGAAGNRLAGDILGGAGDPVLLLHGGGQTRHAWRRTALRLAQEGWRAIAIDQRGHGDSDWVEDGAYAFADYAADVAHLAPLLAARFGRAPVAVGASLGGIAALDAAGLAGEGLLAGLVLVDVTPSLDADGVGRVQGFMGARADAGFASVEEAADAVAAYLPHRPRPASIEGLKKNLRRSPDGRWRWHWDPRFLQGPRTINHGIAEVPGRLRAAARRLTIPTLLVRGARSELVRTPQVDEFRALVPHAELADVAGAAHMVAGDRNDPFADAVTDFLARRLKRQAA